MSLIPNLIAAEVNVVGRRGYLPGLGWTEESAATVICMGDSCPLHRMVLRAAKLRHR